MKPAPIQLALATLLVSVSWAQTALTMSGRVLESETRSPLGQVTISSPAATADTASTSDGIFVLHLMPSIKEGNAITIHAQRTGYVPRDVTVAVSTEIPIDIVLSKPQGSSSNKLGDNKSVTGRAHRSVNQKARVTVQFACDATMLPIDVSPGDDAYFLTLSRSYTSDFMSFHNASNARYLWPISDVQPITDSAQQCSITNISTQDLFNLLVEFKIRFTAQNGAIVTETLFPLQRDSLKHGTSFSFFVINQSRVLASLYPPDHLLANIISDAGQRSIPLTRRKASPLDALPVPLFGSDYQWQGNKIIRRF